MALAERGKIGMPHSSSECSSNSSVEASVESNTGLVGGEKKDRRLILPSASGGQRGSSSISPLKEEEGKVNNNGKYGRLPVQHQDSLEDVPDINSNQDVSDECWEVVDHLG